MEAMHAAKWLLRQAEGANQRSRNFLKQPDGMLDDLWREAMAAIADLGHFRRLSRYHVGGIRFYVTMPL